MVSLLDSEPRALYNPDPAPELMSSQCGTSGDSGLGLKLGRLLRPPAPHSLILLLLLIHLRRRR